MPTTCSWDYQAVDYGAARAVHLFDAYIEYFANGSRQLCPSCSKRLLLHFCSSQHQSQRIGNEAGENDRIPNCVFRVSLSVTFGHVHASNILGKYTIIKGTVR